MPDDNKPGEGTVADATVEQDPMAALADILDDPETDTKEDKASDAGKTELTKETDEVDLGDEGEPDDSAKTDTDEDEDEPEELKGGRIAPMSAKVRMPDGTLVTVQDLADAGLRQSDYTRKTQSLADERKQFDSEKQRVDQTLQQLHEHHERINWWLDQTKPVRPQTSYAEDPIAHGEYREQMDRWNEAVQYWKAEREKLVASTQEQRQQDFAKYLQSETEALFAAIPALRDKDKRDAFTKEAARVVADYGISEQEIASLTDHRMILVLRDALKYRRLQAKAPKVKAEMAGKPKLMTGSKRPNSKQIGSRDKQARTERLRTEGTLDAGIRSLMDLDL